jgi:hypothetical protein
MKMAARICIGGRFFDISPRRVRAATDLIMILSFLVIIFEFSGIIF